MECIGCVRGKNKLRDSRREILSIMPILAHIGTHGYDVFDRNEKVRKAAKHDFFKYWSVLGSFVAKTHFVIRAANFCQQCQHWHILAHTDAMFLTGMKKLKKHQNMIF